MLYNNFLVKKCKFLSEILVNKWNFCQKMEICVKNGNFDKKSYLFIKHFLHQFLTIFTVCFHSKIMNFFNFLIYLKSIPKFV